uniref:Putative secreted protein n=1 Tax=Rhipicephalus microplus TaxID=6941 RepID=A0A6G5A088_RHIMP
MQHHHLLTYNINPVPIEVIGLWLAIKFAMCWATSLTSTICCEIHLVTFTCGYRATIFTITKQLSSISWVLAVHKQSCSCWSSRNTIALTVYF